jgi:hypothetical protein
VERKRIEICHYAFWEKSIDSFSFFGVKSLRRDLPV